MQAVILAAGQSSRFWPLNKDHKSLTYIMGKPILYWTIKGLVENGITEIMVVHSPESKIKEILDKENDLGVTIKYVVQEKPLGTGNTWWQAKDFVKEPVLFVWGNKVNTGEIVAKMKEEVSKGAEAVLVGAETDSPWDYGVIKKDGDSLEIIENPKKNKEPSNIKIIGLYYFGADIYEYYEKLPKHHEADSVEVINNYIKDKKTSLITLEKDVPALKYPWELFGILDILLKGSNVSKSAKIGKNVVIEGDVHIGNNTIIKDNTVIQGPCYIGDNVEIGFSNVLRGPLNIESDVKTGAFCEIKHSIVQKGTHFHSGYIGDSIIGENCRFGAGFIAACKRIDRENIKVEIAGKKVDSGYKALGVVIGDNTKFGIQTGTMPGILVGSDCIVGPGVQLFENLKDKTKKK